MTVLPMITAPVARRCRADRKSESLAIRLTHRCAPQAVGSPFTSMMSLIPNGDAVAWTTVLAGSQFFVQSARAWSIAASRSTILCVHAYPAHLSNYPFFRQRLWPVGIDNEFGTAVLCPRPADYSQGDHEAYAKPKLPAKRNEFIPFDTHGTPITFEAAFIFSV